MAPPKASGWPAYIFNDPAVQKLDERGRFIVCRMCAEYYAACGGKKPKPIVLNGCYRTRAWEVHKQRTRAHNPSQEKRSTSSAPSIPASSVLTSSGSQSRPGSEPRRWWLHEPRSINHRYGPEAVAGSPQTFNEPPLRDRRRSLSPPRSLISTWRRRHPVEPESFARASPYQQKTSTRRMRPAPLLSLALVFPLVRTPAELRRPSDFDPDWGAGNDWRRLLSSRSPATTRAQWRSDSLFVHESLKVPAYAVPEALR